MVSFRSRRTILIITIAGGLCIAVLLVAGLSRRLNMDGIKSMVKVMLRGHVDPEKLDTGLPMIRINTHNGQFITSREEYTGADIEIVDAKNIENNLRGIVEIRGRGNSTSDTISSGVQSDKNSDNDKKHNSERNIRETS
jgi:hypothetical protein